MTLHFTKIIIVRHILAFSLKLTLKINIFHFIFKVFKSNENNTDIINRLFFHTEFNNSISYCPT